MIFPSELLRKCWFLAGPTASGKSAASLVLAQTLDAEIISLDSMAIYRGMDIGTAKPSAEDQQRVPHHMIDIANPEEDFSVAEFLKLTLNAAEDIDRRGRVPLFVGGTGLYLRAILRGLFEGPSADWTIRQRWEEQARANGPEWLHEQLRAVDPVTAERLHANDMRRLIRALEVFEITGRPISEDQQHGPKPKDQQPRCVAWIEPPRDWLRARIDRRVDQMMEEGWLAETERLMQRDPAPGRTASQALGYRELMEHLQTKNSLAETVEQVKTATRQFAKRQHTWFRNLEECQAVSISGSESPDEIARRVLTVAGA